MDGMSILSPKSKAIWLSAKILIKVRTSSTDGAILIWILSTNNIFSVGCDLVNYLDVV